MLGLLRKDLLVTIRSTRLLFILALLCNLIPQGAVLGNTYAVLLPFMVPLTAFSSDERCHWDRLASMLPCRTEQLVGCKFLLCGIFTLLSVGILLLGAAVRSVIFPGSVSWTDLSELVAITLAAAVLITAVSLPLQYRLSSEGARYLMLVPLMGGTGAALGVHHIASTYGGWHTPPAVLALLILTGAAVLWGSFRLSVRCCRNRMYGAYD